MSIFANIEGQERTTSFLQQSLESGKLSHAYLLAGAPNAAAQIAEAFAFALAEGPDVQTLAPQSQAGYLIDQIRDLNTAAQLAPIRGQRKVFVLQAAHKLQGAAANALLKTLEEPHASTVFILLAPTAQSTLETIRSRCLVLALATEEAQQQAANLILEAAQEVAAGASNQRLLMLAEQCSKLGEPELERLQQQQNEELAAAKDFLTAGARREMEQRHKREQTAAQREIFQAGLNSVQSWLRQSIAAAPSAPCAPQIQARKAVSRAQQQLDANVTPQLAFEACFLEIRRALCLQP